MIKVTIELISAITTKTSEIGRMYIANDGTGSMDRSDYNVGVCRRGLFDQTMNLATGRGAARSCKVMDYPREAYNVWRLIARAVLAAFPEEIKTKPGKAYAAVVTPDVMQGMARVAREWMQMDGAKNQARDDQTICAFLVWLTESTSQSPDETL